MRPDIALSPPGVETLPPGELARLGEERLIAGRVIERAARGAMCRGLWRLPWRRLPRLRDRLDLQRLPYASAANLLQAQGRGPLRRVACAPAYFWAASAGAGEGRKWIPVGKGDFELALGLMDRLARTVKIKEKAVVLAVPPLAPRRTNALPYHWMLADMIGTKLGLEFIVASMFMLGKNNWPGFALRRQPDVLLCRPSDALLMAGHFALAAGRPGARPRDLLPNLKTGIFFGEPLAPLREKIVEAYGLEAFDLYLSAEHAGMNVECPKHQGVHFWMDTCVPEIIPISELEGEGKEPGFVPGAGFLDAAPPGSRGELVVTTFAEALPLVRYRTGDLITLVDRAPCACGITHPRIQVLGRRSAAGESRPAP